jgi:O-antigen ligase
VTAGVCIVLALMAGAAAVKLEPLVAATLALGAGAALLISRRPSAGALCVMLLIGTLPRSLLFDHGVPLLGGQVKVTDLLLAVTLLSWLISALSRRGNARLPSRGVTLLLLALMALSAVGLLTARRLGFDPKLGLLELRPLLSYLLIFPLVSDLNSMKRIERSIGVVLVIAAVASVATLYQYVTGQGTETATYTGGAIRVRDIGFLYPLVGLIWAVAILPYAPRGRWVRLGVLATAGLTAAALFFTFQRGAWLALVVAVPALLAMLPPRRRRKMIARGVPLLVGGLVLVMGFNAIASTGVKNPLAAGLERLSSTGSSSDPSGQYRINEWTTALRQVHIHPLSGIGLGGTITFENPELRNSPQGTVFTQYYIHNSYVWYALKLGLPGLAAILLLLALSYRAAWRAFRRWTDPRGRRLLLGVLASLLAIMVVAATGPHLNIDAATPLVAFTIAIAQALNLEWRKGQEH